VTGINEKLIGGVSRSDQSSGIVIRGFRAPNAISGLLALILRAGPWRGGFDDLGQALTAQRGSLDRE
jgi:hypothetical protein